VPVVATEIGSQSTAAGCDRDAPIAIVDWLDAHTSGYLGWTWDAWGNCDSLISDYAGTPTSRYGRAFHDHLLGIPQAPTHVIAAAGDASASVSWLPPTDHGSSNVSGYTITASPGGATKPVPAGQTNATITGLNNGTTYIFTVSATNSAGTGAGSDASAAVTSLAGNAPATAVETVASASSSTPLATSTDPALTGGTATAITVPSGTSGGTVTIMQSSTTSTSPTGYLFGGTQIDINAPTASATNPLVLVFTTTAGTTQIYRTEGTGTPTPVGPCSDGSGQASPDPCVSARSSVTINGITYTQLTVLSSSASRWNPARPKPLAVSVNDNGYTPTTATIQPGATGTWTFTGKKAHSVTESLGLGPSGKPWFDSGAKTTGSYSFTFPAAGSYRYASTVKGDTLTGTIQALPITMPASGPTNTRFSIIWSTNTITGYVFDVKYRFKPAGSGKWGNWNAWEIGTSAASGTFTPSSRGTYSFQTRTRNTATGKTSGYSPEANITVG
jgi:plastocyanin